MTSKKVILITGPTASGKTGMAIEVARRYGTSIISADSRQCFREMSVGVAKPSAQELTQVKHYFINSHSIHDEVNARTFESYALSAAEEIFRDHDTLVMAGGTGLYIKAFCEGLDDMPAVPASIRQQVITQYEQKGMEWLRREVARLDPVYYAGGEILNPRRLMRALEIRLATGRSLRDFQRKTAASRNFEVVKYAVDLPRPILHERINKRVDQMIDTGLIDEAHSLMPFREKNALQTVGYTELFDYFDGRINLPEAIDRIKINTRHYARRQMTWFRRDSSIQWIQDASQVLPG